MGFVSSVQRFVVFVMASLSQVIAVLLLDAAHLELRYAKALEIRTNLAVCCAENHMKSMSLYIA